MLKSKQSKSRFLQTRFLTRNFGSLAAWFGVTSTSLRLQKSVKLLLWLALLCLGFISIYYFKDQFIKDQFIKDQFISMLFSFYTGLDLSKNLAVLIGVIVTAIFSWKNLKLTEEKLVTERLAKAFEQLSSDNSTLRLGAIYTLERIATESVVECRSIIEILASFIRSSAPQLEETQNVLPPIAPGVQSALIAIAGLTRKQKLRRNREIRPVDASHFYLARADLTALDLREITLSQSDLRQCNLDGTDLEASDLTNADLSGAYLGEANFRYANLSKAKLDRVNVANQQTKQADFSHAILTDAHLIEARLSRSLFIKANLRSVNLRAANLREADFRYSIVSLADLTNADLSCADFSHADLVNTVLDGADIYKAKFAKAKISNLELLKKAKNWKTADYDPVIRQKLGLS